MSNNHLKPFKLHSYFAFKHSKLSSLCATRNRKIYLILLSVQNLLPLHVAEFYLRAERGVEDLFAERRNNAGVLFASIPNFPEFYSEDVNEGVECIRLLNEIIIDFDEILDDEKFVSVEKIKTVGSTYMAASGITPSSDKVKYFLPNIF